MSLGGKRAGAGRPKGSKKPAVAPIPKGLEWAYRDLCSTGNNSRLGIGRVQRGPKIHRPLTKSLTKPLC